MSQANRCPPEKGKKAEGFWDTYPGGMEKMVLLLAATLNPLPEWTTFGCGYHFWNGAGQSNFHAGVPLSRSFFPFSGPPLQFELTP